MSKVQPLERDWIDYKEGLDDIPKMRNYMALYLCIVGVHDRSGAGGVRHITSSEALDKMDVRIENLD